MPEKVENKDICATCGGMCCKKSGCDYFVSDFDNFKLDYLESILATGRVSIIASLFYKENSVGKLFCVPFLSLRARNVDRSEIDLFSFKKSCASLEEHGCYYSLEDRPGGGAALIPCENGRCYTAIDRMEELEKQRPYQNILARIVKRHTGKSVNAKLEEDVENVFYDILTKNFDGVMDIEIQDVLSGLDLLKKAFLDSFFKACHRYLNETPAVLLRTHNNKFVNSKSIDGRDKK